MIRALHVVTRRNIFKLIDPTSASREELGHWVCSGFFNARLGTKIFVILYHIKFLSIRINRYIKISKSFMSIEKTSLKISVFSAIISQ